jgi:hypothetical protein
VTELVDGLHRQDAIEWTAGAPRPIVRLELAADQSDAFILPTMSLKERATRDAGDIGR